jgi:TetR/AcrR family tetracycline transcriptional repressor
MARSPGTRAGLIREDVVGAARDLLVIEGFPAVTMRKVAEVLGVAPNTLYSHVKDRDDLADGVLDLELARIAMPDAGTTQNRVELVMRALWNLLVSRPGLATHLLERTNWSAELARLRRDLGDLFKLSAPRAELATDYVGVLLSYTIGSAALAGSMNVVSADRVFREGLALYITALNLEPVPGRFSVREFQVVEDTQPGRAGDIIRREQAS